MVSSLPKKLLAREKRTWCVWLTCFRVGWCPHRIIVLQNQMSQLTLDNKLLLRLIGDRIQRVLYIVTGTSIGRIQFGYGALFSPGGTFLKSASQLTSQLRKIGRG